MKFEKIFLNKLRKLLNSRQIIFDAPMKNYTTFKIGGIADILVFPHTIEDISNVIKLSNEFQIPHTVLGNGSNVLIRDKGIRGIVIKLAEIFFENTLYCNESKIIVSAEKNLKEVSEFALKNSLSGLEFAFGIPGSIGGAVFMNAGAYGHEMKDIVSSVSFITSKSEFMKFSGKQLRWDYRYSNFQDINSVIYKVELSLEHSDSKKIENKMEKIFRLRNISQPCKFPNAGSIFKRPANAFAGQLIENVGLKGFNIGDAKISEKHAGFIINIGNATAANVLSLIEKIQKEVYEFNGTKLEIEIRVLGEE